jgi:adenylate cyclase
VLCGTPLDGPISRLFRLVGVRRSHRNPHLCTRCSMHVEEGRLVEITVLFADLTGFTALTQQLGAERTHEVVDGFLRMSTAAIARHDGFVDKYIGDAVIALFNAPIRRVDHAAQAVAAAEAIHAGLAELRERLGLDLHASAGIARGFARVGRLGSSDERDFTAIGDVVNLAARLEAQTRAGETLVDAAVYAALGDRGGNVAPETLALKGFAESVAAYRFGATTPLPIGAPSGSVGLSRRFGLGSIVFAVLGAPCAAAALIGPAAVIFGFGTLFSAGSVIYALDETPAHIPILLVAALGAVANLYIAWHARQLRRRDRAEARFSEITSVERRRGLAIITMSVVTLALVGAELYSHTALMGHSFF